MHFRTATHSNSFRNIAIPANAEIGDSAFFCCPQHRLLSDIEERVDYEAAKSDIVNAL